MKGIIARCWRRTDYQIEGCEIMFGLLGTKKWNLTFFVEGQARYKMTCTSPVRMLGYVMLSYEKSQKKNTKIVLRSDKTNRESEVTAAWFDLSKPTVSAYGRTQLDLIDPNWYGAKGEPSFIDLRTKKAVSMDRVVGDHTEWLRNALSDVPQERTIFDILNYEFFD